MPQVTVHASPETHYFDTPPVVEDFPVTIRRPALFAPGPINPACYANVGFVIKGTIQATEAGIPQPSYAFKIRMTGQPDVPANYYNLVQLTSVALGGDTYAVEYGILATSDSFNIYNYIIGGSDLTVVKILNLTLQTRLVRRDFDLTEFYAIFSTSLPCGEFPPDDTPVGDDTGDDDDDSAGASGQYRAIEADSPRNWLHVGSGSSIVTYHTTPGDVAFTSSGHPPKWWKQFCYNQRNSGALACLGRDSDPGSSTVFLSYDGGQSVEEVFNVEGTSVVMDYDSEREWLVVLTEGTPPDVEDPTSHGVVSRYISRDFGQNFTAEGTVLLEDADMSARLLGMTYDPRTGGTLYLLCKVLGVTKILASEDGGDSWEERFS